MVCIDDFALKKRQRYGTVMVDLQTRKIVEMEDVAQWLAGFPNLCTVSRDGSQVYAAAIAKAHPKAVQVSDRFHLIKNLTDRATQALQKQFQGRIAIPITDETQRRQAIMMARTLEPRQRPLRTAARRQVGTFPGRRALFESAGSYVSGNSRVYPGKGIQRHTGCHPGFRFERTAYPAGFAGTAW
jgi:hypothetical protein